MTDCTSCINHIINQNTSLTFNTPNDIHHFTRIHLIDTPAFINNRNRSLQKFSQFPSTSHTTMVWTDNNIVFSNHPATFEIICDQRRPHQVVNRNIKETLNLSSVQINCQQTINSSNLKHISYQLRSDWFTSPSFPVLTSIAVIRHHHINRLRTSSFQRIYHNQNFHKIIINR